MSILLPSAKLLQAGGGLPKNPWRQEALQMQRDYATMHFVNCNYKSDHQAQSRSLVFVPLDRWYMISR